MKETSEYGGTRIWGKERAEIGFDFSPLLFLSL